MYSTVPLYGNRYDVQHNRQYHVVEPIDRQKAKIRGGGKGFLKPFDFEQKPGSLFFLTFQAKSLHRIIDSYVSLAQK